MERLDLNISPSPCASTTLIKILTSKLYVNSSYEGKLKRLYNFGRHCICRSSPHCVIALEINVVVSLRFLISRSRNCLSIRRRFLLHNV
ncbi:hypothetical protein Y032_0395g650 [Ancylostoma ceylanicum]|uniref:Uncharacterized protein n=1 Tax=Ancylostoma ceylanicum TaxID=53326 RepID=A0A016RRT0_9BILA|nr:hypothetical protein Y032_0395g650 [Ancylostoma ceylanicum]